MFKIKEDGKNKIRRRKSDMKVMKVQTLGAVEREREREYTLLIVM